MKAAVVAVVLVAACSPLPDIQPGVCGNGIVDSDEDCDSPEDECQQCGLRCRAGVCPDNYVCGVDKFCHAPGGRFEIGASSVAFPVLGFGITDINSDRYGDILGLNLTALTVRYGDAQASLSDEYSVVTPLLQGNPAVTDLEQRGVIDLVMPTADGLAAYTAALGVPSPRQFPFIGGGPDDPNGPGLDILDAVAIERLSGIFTAIDPDGQGPAPAVLALQLLGVGDQGPELDAASLLCSPTAPMNLDENRTTVYQRPDGAIVSISPVGGPTCVLLVTRLAQPAPRGSGSCPNPGFPLPPCKFRIDALTTGSFPALAKKPAFADLDGDGCPSLLDVDGGPQAYKEFDGSAGGSFGCQLAATSTSLAPINSVYEDGSSQILGSVPLNLTASTLSSEALIMSNGIYAFPATGEAVRLYSSDRRVERAAIGDLNDDGEIDVVLSTDAPSFDLARRVLGSAAFLLVRVPTIGQVTSTTIGDFDGDGKDDLAYVEQLGNEQRLSLAYGAPGGLLPGVAADAFTRVEYISVVQVRDSTDPFGIVEDLLVFDIPDPNDPTGSEGTLLHGSPQRTMLSFYGQPSPEQNTPFRMVVAGHFLNHGIADKLELPDLLAFQIVRAAERADLHLLRGVDGGRLEDALESETMGMMRPVPPWTTDIGECRGPPPAIQYDFCVDSAKLLAWPGVAGHDIVIGIDGHDPPRVIQLDPLELRSGIGFQITAQQLQPFPGGTIESLHQHNLDDDSAPELVAAFAPREGQPGYTKICKVTAGVVFDCLDVATDIIGTSMQCIGAALGRVAPKCEAKPDKYELVVLCRDESSSIVTRIRFENGNYVADDPLVSAGDVTQKARFGQLQIGDVTGDGLDDIVVVDKTTGLGKLRVYIQQTSRRADNVCVSAE